MPALISGGRGLNFGPGGLMGGGGARDEATTNLAIDPSFEMPVSAGWGVTDGTIHSDGGIYGAASMVAGTVTYQIITVTNGVTYTLSFWHKGKYSINLDHGDGVLHALGSEDGPLGEWQRYSTTFVASGNAAAIYLYTHEYDAVQLEAKDHVTPYCDGDQPGCTWTGVPHASVSTRP